MSDHVWGKSSEILPRSYLKKLQLFRFLETFHQASRVSYYSSLFRRLSLSAESIKSQADVRKLPLTNETEMVACGLCLGFKSVRCRHTRAPLSSNHADPSPARH